MTTCDAFDTCQCPALWEVRGWPDEGQTTLMCSYHAEPFFDERIASLFTHDGITAEEMEPTPA